MTWLAIRLALSKVPARVYLGAGTLALLALGIWAAIAVARGALDRAKKKGRTEVQHDAEVRVASYDHAVQVLGTQLRSAQLQLASSARKVEEQLPKTEAALTAVTPEIRATLPTVVQVALEEADTLLPLVTQLRIDVTTVTVAAAAIHAIDTAMIHAQAVVINTVTTERDSVRAESAKKITKTKAIGGALLSAALAWFTARQIPRS